MTGGESHFGFSSLSSADGTLPYSPDLAAKNPAPKLDEEHRYHFDCLCAKYNRYLSVESRWLLIPSSLFRLQNSYGIRVDFYRSLLASLI